MEEEDQKQLENQEEEQLEYKHENPNAFGE